MIKKIIFVLLVVTYSSQIAYPMQKEKNDQVLKYTKEKHCKCTNDPESLLEASQKFCKYHCEFFLKKGEDPNTETLYEHFGSEISKSPLRYAINYRKKKIIRLLLDHGIHVNKMWRHNGKNHLSPLFLVALNKKNFFIWFLEELKTRYETFLKNNDENNSLPFFVGKIPPRDFYTTIHQELIERKDAFGRTAWSMMKKKNQKVLEKFLGNHINNQK